MMTEKNKMECDDLLKTHEMTQKLLDANTADAAMLATLVQMARGGERRDGDVYASQSQALRH